MRTVVMSNGKRGPAGFYEALIGDADRLVCADGGANHALALGLWPDLVVGDMDSIDPGVRARLEAAAKTRFVVVPEEKDASDTDLALKEALAGGASEIVLTCVLGDRFDHALANVALLATVPAVVRCSIAEPGMSVMLVRDHFELGGPAGRRVSIMPFGGDARGVSLEGFKYPLSEGTLEYGATLGLSNVTTGEAAGVSISSGMVLVMMVGAQGHWA